MQVTIDISDEKQLELIDALRGEKSPDEFIAASFEQWLKMAEFQRRQQDAAAEAGRHPLLQFPEVKPEFRGVQPVDIEAVLKEKDETNPVAIEVHRLVSAY